MHASFWNSVLIVAVAAAATFLTRVIPFAAFGKRKIPQTVDYLGRILPPAIYCSEIITNWITIWQNTPKITAFVP